ncbi:MULTISPECIES: RodZ family helix-turn-helix domain-containing protein [Thermoactinomyces]|uniref:Helix-turn-helix domain-containing protein n=1 Tax=Thermoactinomyces daqus TaxID=1329516 RepID=A0A7W2AI06_9BACL|nr:MULTISPECIES: helix-turn-helix domain-containing protein [Thermoactinomyces]MBA4542249.1 helix-turn-helix domain-containing protein [Thermoactinomyces daqus]MBH8598299.1 helix-turn-helix domain-containing protein [Thermoactinomyces sp. CICC 10523]MBH8604422.1 helix-turn-helix domain-containing protein [Thermoactinomyces sp. CICC 10522]MBH8607577.1 helix-turn-helix domain-containing protein [Thermoactinomyces sp. CICC 10521]
MANPFEQLKETREQLEMSVSEAADRAGLEPDYIEALERADFSALPDPLYVRGFIRSYAKVLGIDPNPLLRYYRTTVVEDAAVNESLPVPASEEENASLSRAKSRKVKRRKKADWERVKIVLLNEIEVLNKKLKWILISSIAVLLVAAGVIVWLIFGMNKPQVNAVKSITPAQSSEESDGTVAPVSAKRPVVTILESAETGSKYGDVYGISNADQVELTIAAQEPTDIRARSGGPNGDLIADKELAAGQTVTFTDKEWISLRIDHPDRVQLHANGVLIDTSAQKAVSLFQFKRVESDGQQSQNE